MTGLAGLKNSGGVVFTSYNVSFELRGDARLSSALNTKNGITTDGSSQRGNPSRSFSE